MPFKPNYNFQRAERDRAKAAKKEERLAMKKQLSEQRKAAEAGGIQAGDDRPQDQAPQDSQSSGTDE